MKPARLILVLLAAILTALRPGSAPAQPDAPAAPPADADPFVEAVRGVRPSVAAVGSYHFKDKPTVRYFGTGFVIADGSVIVTNHHVTDAIRTAGRLDSLRVFFPGDRAVDGRKATLWAEDRFHDLALIKFEGEKVAPLTIRPDIEPPQGRSVGVIGYPIGLVLGLVPAVHRGVVAAVVPAVLPLPAGAKMTPELAEAIRRPYNLYQLDLLVFPGHSGSPVFDAHSGQVLGIINKTLASRTREHLLKQPTAISYAVPARWIDELLTRATAEAGPTQDPKP